jgi:hypothetical protein
VSVLELAARIRRGPIQSKWLATEAILKWVRPRTLSAKQNQYRERFREKIRAGDLGTSWKEKLAGDLILDGLVEKVRRMLKRKRIEQKPLRALEKAPVDWGRIIEAIERVWDGPWEEVSHGKPARELAMLIAWRYGG